MRTTQSSQLSQPARSISIVVPVYNSEQTLEELCNRVRTVLRETASEFEILLVEDGSHDQSWSVIGKICETLPEARGFCLMRNSGQHSALLCGIREARYEWTVTLDDDLQNPPEEIPKLLREAECGFDVVYGRPRQEQHGFFRNCASRITKVMLQRAMGADVARQISAFRIFRTCLRGAFEDFGGTFVSIDVLLTWATTRFSAIQVEHAPRMAGSSNYTVRQLLTHAINMVTGFSNMPLQLASFIGFASTFLGLVVLTYVIGRTLIQGVAVPGFAFLACTIAIFSGAQLFSLGIIGEYLARIHTRSMQRPPYVVREQIHPGSDRS